MSNDNRSVAEMIADMEDGEVFLYGSTYNEKLVIQADELHLMFCYHDELHKAERDYGDEAFQLLSEMYNNGASLDLPTDLRERMRAIVDGPAEEHAKGKLPASADECTVEDDSENVGGTKPAKLPRDVAGNVVIPNVVIRDNRK